MSFSATDAAFEGFRLTRRAPVAVALWALLYVVLMVATLALMGPSLATLMAEVARLQEVASPQPEDLQSLGALYALLVGTALPLSLLVTAVLAAAVARAVLRPAEAAFGYMRLGMDELRVLGVTLVLFVVFAIAWTLPFVLVGVIGGVATASGQGWLWLVAVLLGLAGVAGVIWLLVRLSLAVPLVVAERRFAPFDSFALTKGRFWPLLGMAVISVVMAMIVGLLGSIVVMPITLMTGDLERLAAFEGASMAELLQGAAPALIAFGVINGILSALQLAIMHAPFSAAYRDLKAG
jgi:hypothetical protein